MNIVCGEDYIGHRWSKIPPKKGFCVWCDRCSKRFLSKDVYEAFLSGGHKTSILQGLPIPERLVVQEGPGITEGWRHKGQVDYFGTTIIQDRDTI